MEMHHWARHGGLVRASTRMASAHPQEARGGARQARLTNLEAFLICVGKPGTIQCVFVQSPPRCVAATPAVGALSAQPAAAASYCPNPAHAKPAKVPPDLVAPLAKAFALEPGTLGAAFVRCVGPKLMGCMVGANLVCDKADQRRALPGATAWCRENPGANVIPMAATGHATIYEWSCNGRNAVPGKASVSVDPQGYIANNWKDVR